ncbi:MAG: FtsL-like putative cell division protein [Muribaculaceae bacterium]|nr:FtsL-like putative cell division protein [Muribaculaceae bacterium]
MTAKKKNTKNTAPQTGQINSILKGRMVSLELFKRHGWFIFIATVIIIALIGQRYTNQTKMEEIKRLEKQLATSKSVEINEKARYKSLIREHEMRKLLRERKLDLDYQQQPPYIIPRD